MKAHPRLVSFLLTSGLALVSAQPQTYVTPRLGGGQFAADMIHIDIYYDVEANQLHAWVDDSFGLPQLRPLDPDWAFDPQAPFAVLSDKAYNAQYGWNAGGFFTIPAGAAIWIEPVDRSPGLEVYEGWGRTGSYTPLFGTADSARLWRWSGVMAHNTYAIPDPPTDRLFAAYRLYFGDATTGSREGYEHMDDAQVRLEWLAVPVEEPCQFGALDSAANAPLVFLNAERFVTRGDWVLSLAPTNARSPRRRFERAIPMVALPATAAYGGPREHHAALGACIEVQLVSLVGPPAGHLSVWEPDAAEPLVTMATSEGAILPRLPLSQNQARAGSDPFGRVPGRCFAVDQPGLYTVGFQLVDTSTNGPAGRPIHDASDIYTVHLQAGVTMARTERHGQSFSAIFGGQTGQVYYLERSSNLGPAAAWQTVAGPLAGTNRLQRLTDPVAIDSQGFYRLISRHPQ